MRRDVVEKLWTLGTAHANVKENVIKALLYILSDSSAEVFKRSVASLKSLNAGYDVLIEGITKAFKSRDLDVRLVGIRELVDLGRGATPQIFLGCNKK